MNYKDEKCSAKQDSNLHPSVSGQVPFPLDRSVWYEKLYAGHVNKRFEMYSASQGANYYAIHSLFYLRTIQEKYIKMYKDL